MFRTFLTAIGLVEFLTPERLIDAAERVSLENPDACELRAWVVPGARVEGLAILFLSRGSDASYSTLKRFLGAIGVLALLFPRAYVEYGTELAYVDADRCEWRPWVYPGTRLVGLLYVLLALDTLLGE